MTATVPAWKAQHAPAESDREVPIRVFLDRELPETRIAIAQLVRDYEESGDRARLTALLRDRRGLPWYLDEPDEPKDEPK